MDPVIPSSKRESSTPIASTTVAKSHKTSPPPGIWHKTSKKSSSSKKTSKPPITTVDSSEYTYVDASSSSDSSSTQDKVIDKTPADAQAHQNFNPLQLTKRSIGDLNSLSTIELQARVLMTKACDKEISVEEFYKYFTFTNLPFFCPKQLDKSKP
ncbi:MAG: hypothetical protein OIF58_15725, partial [Cohaesibacter sp.]|nr:hypothetical protein [Cohaesibacter sp.]